MILNTDDDCLDAVNVVGEDAAGAVLVVVQRVRRGLDLNSRTETLQVGQRLPRLKLNLVLYVAVLYIRHENVMNIY